MKAVVLAGGAGTRLWPYAQIRNKVMAPVANRPLVAWAADAALETGADEIIVAAGPHAAQITHYFAVTPGYNRVSIVEVGQTRGPAFTLAAVRPRLDEATLVLNGDTLVESADLRALVERLRSGAPAVLLARLKEDEHGDYICAEAEEGVLTTIEGHPRWSVGHASAAASAPTRSRRSCGPSWRRAPR